MKNQNSQYKFCWKAQKLKFLEVQKWKTWTQNWEIEEPTMEISKNQKYPTVIPPPQDLSFLLTVKILRCLFRAQKGFPLWECFILIYYRTP